MAAHPIPKDKRDAIIVDWRMGERQKDIADKHKVAIGTVNKLVRGVPQDGQDIVKLLIESKQVLAAQDEMMVNAVNDAATVQLRRLNFFDGAQLSLAKVALARVLDEDGKVKEGVPMAEVKAVSDVVNTSRIGVMPATKPGVAIQINNNSAYALPEYQQALRDVLDSI